MKLLKWCNWLLWEVLNTSVLCFVAVQGCICFGLDLNPSRITLDPIHVKNEGYCWLEGAKSAGSKDPGHLVWRVIPCVYLMH